MVAFSMTLYTWLLSGKLANLHVMLLIGMIIGAGLGSLSTFMQRMMDLLPPTTCSQHACLEISRMPIPLI